MMLKLLPLAGLSLCAASLFGCAGIYFPDAGPSLDAGPPLDARLGDAPSSRDDAGSPLTLAEYARRAVASNRERRCAPDQVRRLNPYDYILFAGDVARLSTDPNVAFDPVAAAACLAVLELPCSDADFLYPQVFEIEACRNVVRGRLPLGAACESRVQCASGACSGCEGMCVDQGTLVSALEGEACNSGLGAARVPSRGTCADGLQCAHDVCRPYRFDLPLGAECDPSNALHCAPGLSCVGIPTTTGRCQPRVALGDACAGAFPSLCPAGSACSNTTLTCTPLPSADEPCLRTPLGESRCAAGHMCEVETCRRMLEVGDACSTPWAICPPFSACGGICEVPTWYPCPG